MLQLNTPHSTAVGIVNDSLAFVFKGPEEKTDLNFFETDIHDDVLPNSFRSGSIGFFSGVTANIIASSSTDFRVMFASGIAAGILGVASSTLSTWGDSLMKSAARDAVQTPEMQKMQAEDILFWANETRMIKSPNAPQIDVNDLSVEQQQALVTKYASNNESAHYESVSQQTDIKPARIKRAIGMGLSALGDAIAPMATAGMMALIDGQMSTAALVVSGIGVAAIGVGAHSAQRTFNREAERIVNEEREEYHQLKLSSFKQRYEGWKLDDKKEQQLNNAQYNSSVFEEPITSQQITTQQNVIEPIDIDLQIASFAQKHKQWKDSHTEIETPNNNVPKLAL